MRDAPILLVCLGAVLLAAGCRRRADTQQEPPESASAGIFSDRAVESGLDFVHFNGMTGDYDYREMMGGGGAMFDYDGDGDLDIYLVQGSLLSPEDRVEQALFPPRHPQPFSDRLYRNDSSANDSGAQRLRFEDMTADIAVEPAGYGMGVAVGDIDNDGWPDLYRTAFGRNQLLRNRGDGTFLDITARAGVDDSRWSVAAVFFDYDRDGRLDLWVGNYLGLTTGNEKICRDAAGAQDYCGPTAYPGVTDRLFRNRGDGTFEDVGTLSGVGTKVGRTMGAVAADLDDDGWLDLYVANDGEPNFLWINQGDGRFLDEALWRGCAVNAAGLPQASMGVDAGDFDNDGDLDLFMTHLAGESNALFRNDGDGSFSDISGAAGLSVASWPLTGFGTHFLDFDNDGWLDLLTVSGAVTKIETLAQRGDPYPLHQPKQLYRNTGEGRFEEIGERSGEVFALSEVGRGAAFGDVDNDGDVDVLVVNSNGQARLLVNQVGSVEPWIGFRLVEVATGRVLVGARLVGHAADESRQLQRVATDGSYASANDCRVLMGSRHASRSTRFEIAWPNGGSTRLVGGLAPGHYHVVLRTP